MHPVALTEITVGASKTGEDTPIHPYGPGSLEDAQERIYGLPPGLRKMEAMEKQQGSSSTLDAPPHSARRQFSFQNVFGRGTRTPDPDTSYYGARSPSGRSRAASERRARKNATEEEQLGLVKGDSQTRLVDQSPEHYPLRHGHSDSASSASSSSSLNRAPPYGQYDADSDDDYHHVAGAHSEPVLGVAQQPASIIGAAVPMATSAMSTPPRGRDLPPLPRPSPGPLPTSAQMARRPPPSQGTSYYSQASSTSAPSASGSGARDRSRSEVEYERSRERFATRRNDGGPGPGAGAGAGGGAFI